MKWSEVVRQVAAALAEVTDTARLDAELLIAYHRGQTREALLLSDPQGEVAEGWQVLLERRLTGEPLAYIIGQRDFWDISLKVGPGALIPRPDSETLIETAIAHFGEGAGRGPRTILDLGTGPGTLLLAALSVWPEATGVGVDLSDVALGYARANAESLGMVERAEFIVSDWTASLSGVYDLIPCNPPYIGEEEILPHEVLAHEPGTALFAKEAGLADYRRLAKEIGRLLKPAAIALIEIGWQQKMAVSSLFEAQGFSVDCYRDIAGRDRCLKLSHN